MPTNSEERTLSPLEQLRASIVRNKQVIFETMQRTDPGAAGAFFTTAEGWLRNIDKASKPGLSPLERELLDACEWARDALAMKAVGLQRRALARLREAISAVETGKFVRCEHNRPPSICNACFLAECDRAEALAKPLDGAETP